MLDFEGICVLISGDTSHRPVLLQPLLEIQPDSSFLASTASSAT
jgi:hypothetical protein